jgi:ABC-type nitrate/sulfonate/bicarbonate transport system substrate-binding protein
MRRHRIAIFILLITLLGATDYATSQLTSVKIGHNAFTDETVFYLGRDVGIFKKHGIHLELIYIPGGSLSVQALMGNSLDMLLAGGTPLVYAVLKGADLKYIAGLNNRMPYGARRSRWHQFSGAIARQENRYQPLRQQH